MFFPELLWLVANLEKVKECVLVKGDYERRATVMAKSYNTVFEKTKHDSVAMHFHLSTDTKLSL